MVTKMNLQIGFPSVDRPMTARGFARLLAVAAQESGNVGKGTLSQVLGMLEDAGTGMQIEGHGPVNASDWLLNLAEELETAICSL